MRTFKVVRVIEHAPLLKSFYVDAPFAAEPGQFVNLWIPGVDEKPFSISDLADGLLELSVKGLGSFTRRLMDVRPGDWLGIRGPHGSPFRLEDNSVLVGGGIGFAPLRFLARRLRDAGLKHRVAIGVRARDDLIFSTELTGYEIASEDGSVGELGRVTGVLEPMLDAARPRAIYAAGPEPMLLAVRDIAKQRGIPAQLSLERYMKCGVGLCGQCCLDGPGARVCVEGPVFEGSALEGVTELGAPHRTASGRRPTRAG
jgi:dihydroorotate dehydrogenase electron transfer subunit